MWRWPAISLGSFLFLAAITIWWLGSELNTPYYGQEAPETFVEIPRGASSAQIAGLLENAGVLRHRIPFVLYLRWTGKGRSLKAGDYLFNSPATPAEIADRLERGDVFYLSITIPEGLTARETIALIAQNGLLEPGDLEKELTRTEWIREISPQARNLEGYLFPETYRFPRRATPEQVIKAMVERFRQVFGHLRMEHPPAVGLTAYEVVTLASLIEKEVRIDAERGLVASVLINRLRLGIPLACDPTIIYALKLAGKYDGNIRKSDLRIESPYNTYLRAGLPPGPIANPGAGSLRAALAPAKTDFLYFVSRNDGSHQFSKDFETHGRAVARYQRAPPQ